MPRAVLAVNIFCIILSSCARMPLTESRWIVKNKTESPFRFYDPKSKIRYDIENDETHLYVTMDVFDAGTKLRMLRTGTRISLASSGKRKAICTVEFPLVEDNTPIDMDPGQYEMTPRDGSPHELKKLLPKEGYFFKGDSVRIPLFSTIESEGFLVSMEIDPSGALLYSAQLPLAKLDLPTGEFTIGFETGAFNIDDPEYERQLQSTGAEGLDRSASFSQSRTGNNATGLGMNQPYGNVGQPGMTTDPYRNAPPRLGVRSSLADPIFFWIRTRLDPSISR